MRSDAQLPWLRRIDLASIDSGKTGVRCNCVLVVRYNASCSLAQQSAVVCVIVVVNNAPSQIILCRNAGGTRRVGVLFSCIWAPSLFVSALRDQTGPR